MSSPLLTDFVDSFQPEHRRNLVSLYEQSRRPFHSNSLERDLGISLYGAYLTSQMSLNHLRTCRSHLLLHRQDPSQSSRPSLCQTLDLSTDQLRTTSILRLNQTLQSSLTAAEKGMFSSVKRQRKLHAYLGFQSPYASRLESEGSI